jgi:hypothetical protein
MRASKVVFVCMCLLGMTQLVWNQDNGVDAGQGTRRQGIPRYIDPRTGTFTTKAQSSGERSQLLAQPSGTPILFREAFIFSIAATDIPAGATISCNASISTSDPNGTCYDSSSGLATLKGNSVSCNVFTRGPART